MFSVGLGFGWTMLNGEADSLFAQESASYMSDGIGEAVQFKDVENVATIVQEARLGARDDLGITVRNQFLLVPTYTHPRNDVCAEGEEAPRCYDKVRDSTEVRYGAVELRADVPIGQRSDLFADFGAQSAGTLWVEGGVSTWVHGAGDRGSVGVQAAAGYGRLCGQPDDKDVEIHGPRVSLGVRWRL